MTAARARLAMCLAAGALGLAASVGAASLLDASLGVFEGGDLTLWTAVPGGGTVALTATGEHAFTGTASAPMRTAAGAAATLEVELEITTERWRWPFELSCAAGFD